MPIAYAQALLEASLLGEAVATGVDNRTMDDVGSRRSTGDQKSSHELRFHVCLRYITDAAQQSLLDLCF